MNYIVFDLEYNQRHPDKNTNTKPPLTFEIIQIGAIKLNSNFEMIGKFNCFVKPTVHKIMHPYVERITKITMDDLNSSYTFPTVYGDFLSFIGNDQSIFITWGADDIKQLIKNIEYYKLDHSSMTKKYIDIQCYTSKHFNCSKGNRIGLKNAVMLLDIESNDDFHDAFFDAFYTSEIFKKLYNKSMKAKSYVDAKSKNIRSGSKEVIDMYGLINQFEKIYNRKMTKEEKEIIKLAFMMGKTRQFIHE